MSYCIYDPDEWETVIESGTFAPIIDGMPSMGYCTFNQRRRSPEEVTVIKERKQREREDAILAEALRIRNRRISECL